MTLSLRWLPRLIVGLAALHIALTPFEESPFWYLIAGIYLLALGELARWAVRETGRVPARLGGWLIATGIAGIVVMPVSGFWLVAALGLVALRAARGRERRVLKAPAFVTGRSR